MARSGRQTELPLARPSAAKAGWGGKRARAGRKPVGARAGAPHRRRPTLAARHPVHVVIRVVEDVRGLRTRHAYAAIRRAMIGQVRRADFRICHLSIQRTHVHLLVEADDATALARGMQGFQISAAKQLNAELSRRRGRRRRGTVFPDRYHAEILTSPTRVRHALAYVVNNWRKHREDRASTNAVRWRVDPFSTAVALTPWRETDLPFRWPRGYQPMPASRPRTWLLSCGWRRAGDVSMFERPASGPRDRARGSTH